MSIKRGSALKEDAKAIITETRFTRKDFTHDRLLLLEGPDDIKVINNYYLYKGAAAKKTFRLIKANDEEIAGSTTIAGKKNALTLFKRLRHENRNVICLLDRDYDFHLKENHLDSRIKYYDYYELENYLFDDSLLKVILKNVCDYPDIECYQKMILLLHDIELACKPYILICFLREVHYRKNILTEEQLDKVLSIIKTSPSSMMHMKHLNTDNKIERIQKYIETELEKVGLSIDCVQKMIDKNDYESSSVMNITEPLHLFKYAIKGKLITNSLTHFSKYILEQDPYLNSLKSTGDLSGSLSRLRIEWIPNLSQDFTRLLKMIEDEFEDQESLQSSTS
ncbi:DUF4435 domain-containing protein [Bacillus cereus]|uniref:DUF4435 domain-containing protein n=1 Tax=Bacillus cereus TaxID=1396 RepID=UPI000BF50CDD|nr:DUF4435 domain-containing protein [Bacillus cereus]PEQ86764.1 hypothetical protein CN482_11750 [Bacillus cereus]PES29018.1 hypothetical protein CN496_15075 [Bacillus cereus]PET80015.1 hypothetical protein CN528_15725 [Bacillus cereus]PEX33010.1 hypothetical protein CN459_12595 [Bacillus cereus]PFC85574.1 hypothetical protein CN276_07315 [Bacillus cereus]